MSSEIGLPLTGKCYCGSISIESSILPFSVVLCHCDSCRRANGAPVAAIAAFQNDAVNFTPDEGQSFSRDGHATRYFCANCGSSTAARYDYLPEQVYVPVALFDQASKLPPTMHSHESERLEWLRIKDDTERFATSSRDHLRGAGKEQREVQ